jgi:large subunit ribosomal protein L6
MSRVGKKPIPIPEKTTVEINGLHVKVSGAKGTLERDLHPEMTARIEGNEVLVERPSDEKRHRALHGLTRALINNMVEGCTTGFKRELNVIGVGYRVESKDKALVLYVGYSHPIVFIPPDGVFVTCQPKENKIFVEGADKELVGLTADKIRSFRKPEPYKGKGIRYANEHVRTKAGKTAG